MGESAQVLGGGWQFSLFERRQEVPLESAHVIGRGVVQAFNDLWWSDLSGSCGFFEGDEGCELPLAYGQEHGGAVLLINA